MLEWFKASVSLFGVSVPHYAIILFVVGAIAEFALGRSKNPKFRSLAGTIFSLLKKLCQAVHVDKLPIVNQLLDFISPPHHLFCPTCKGTGLALETKPNEPATPNPGQ
jgi:hypothetical protein